MLFGTAAFQTHSFSPIVPLKNIRLKTLELFTPQQRNNHLCCLTIRYPAREPWTPLTDQTCSDIRDMPAVPEFSFRVGRPPTTQETKVWTSEQQWKAEGNKGKQNSTKDTRQMPRQNRLL